MRIEEFRVTQYGPLAATPVVRPADFTIFYGPNEAGKTLLLEALARIMLGKKARIFSGIERVDHTPAGYVMLQTGEETHKLPEAGALPELTALDGAQCRNIFVIHNSDLAVEGEFYGDVADRLTGLRTHEIEDVVEALCGIGNLTPTRLELASRDDNDHLADRVQEAEAIVEQIEQLAERAERDGLETCETELARIAERLEEISEELEKLEDARRRQQYEACSQALEGLRQALGELENTEDVTEETLEQWRDAEKTAERCRRQSEDLEGRARRKERQIQELRADLQQKQSDLHTLEDRRESVREAEAGLDECAQLQQEVAAAGAALRFRQVVTGLAGGALIICLLALLLGGGSAWWIPAGLSLVGAAAGGWGWWRATRAERKMRRQLAAIRQQMARAGLRVDSLREALAALGRLRERTDRLGKEAEDLTADLRAAEQTLEALREKAIPETRAELEEAEETIQELSDRWDVEDSAQYRNLLNERRRRQNQVQTHAAVLENQLGKEHEAPAENMEHWTAEVRALERYSQKAPDVDYSQQRRDELREERNSLQRKQAELRKALGSFQEEARQVERRANRALRTAEEDRILCSATTDLRRVEDRLRDFASKTRRRAKLAATAVRLFEEVQQREEAKISRYFGPDSEVSTYFARITDGAYSSVDYASGEGDRRLRVRLAEGPALGAAELSGGAFDQLYLAIRLALGKALLQEGAGFFLMDDPFVKADPERLRRQLSLLKKIAAGGWQVLYFTAKQEVLDALRPELEADEISLMELPGLQR